MEPELSKTVEFLSKSNISLVCTDEPALVPIVLKGTTDFAYIRVHRRTGSNRILSETEIEAWYNFNFLVIERAKRLSEFDYQGTIYMLWNTNYENQSVINSQNLTKKIPQLVFNWKEKIGATPGTLSALFAKAKKEEPKSEEQKAEGKHEDTPNEAKKVNS